MGGNVGLLSRMELNCLEFGFPEFVRGSVPREHIKE